MAPPRRKFKRGEGAALHRAADRPLHQILHHGNLELIVGHRPCPVGRGLAGQLGGFLVLLAAFHHILDDLDVARRASHASADHPSGIDGAVRYLQG